MITITIKDPRNFFRRISDNLSERQLTIAKVRAINVAIRKANTQYKKLATKEYNLKLSDTKNFSIAGRATYTSPQGKISAYVAPISLSRFNPVFIKDGRRYTITSLKDAETKKRSLTQTSRQTKSRKENGVEFTIKKGEKRKVPFAFLVKSEKPGIMQQVWARGTYSGNSFETSKSRMPITALKTVSPFGAFTNEKVQDKIEEGARADMTNEFLRQVSFLLSKAKSKGK